MIQSLPTQSKVWIFMGNQKFTDVQESLISHELFLFFSSWQTHGKDLTAFFEIKYNQFIVIATDESIEKPSGCSIDSLMRLIKTLEKKTGLILLNRSLIGFLNHIYDKEISILSLHEFKLKIKENSFEQEGYVFNPSVSTVGEYINDWIQPLQKCWATSN